MFEYIALAKDKPWQSGPYPGVELLANESVYILSGEWEESGIVYIPGAFFFVRKGVRHGPHIARTEVLSLTIFDGPLTVS